MEEVNWLILATTLLELIMSFLIQSRKGDVSMGPSWVNLSWVSYRYIAPNNAGI